MPPHSNAASPRSRRTALGSPASPSRTAAPAALLVLLLSLAGCASTSSVTPKPAPTWKGADGGSTRAAATAPAEPSFAWDPAEEPVTAPSEERDPGEEAEDGDDIVTSEAAEDDSVPAEEAEVDESAEPSQAPVQDLAVEEPELSPDEIRKERILAEEPEITFDVPMTYNEKVLFWVDYFTNHHRDRFLPGLARSGRYLPMIRRIFAEEGVPLDLAYIAHVESAYKPNALSRARAKGLFQFMAATGRQYGLRQDYWIDERADPEKATRAAAQYLRNLHAMFGDWHLAMAAYNAGEGRISRAMAQTGATDFWSLALTSRIHKETKNYVPAILATMLVAKNPAKYGFDVAFDDPLDYDTIPVQGAVDLAVLARLAGSDPETLHTLNPAIRRRQTPPDRTTDIRVPKGVGEATLAALAELPASERVLYVYHRVRRGETLSRVASRYGVSVAALQRENKMGRRTMLRIGQTLRVPGAGSAAVAAAWRAEEDGAPAARSSRGKVVVYKVRRGDTLSRVAAKYGTTVSAVAAANRFSTRRPLRTGERIKVVPGARSAEVARRATGGGKGTVTASAKRPSGSRTSVHTVRSGDTLWKIAQRYRTTVGDLCELNDLSVGSPLLPGTRLTVSR